MKLTDQPNQLIQPNIERLTALFMLQSVPGFGPLKFRAMHDAGIEPQKAIENPERLPFTGRTGEKLLRGIRSLTKSDLNRYQARAADQLERANHHSASILVHGDAEYPQRVYESNNPVPVLYVRGDPTVWANMDAVAVVGSRNTREPYVSAARTFVEGAVLHGAVVVSGFAIGADSIGHVAAMQARGRTLCVMPCGLDKIFPRENKKIWDELLAYPGAVFVSEFGFGKRASSLSLRKRNKLIVAFAQGVLVVQSAQDGGAMNAYRAGREQRKPVATFLPDDSEETTGNTVIAKDLRTGAFTLDTAYESSDYQSCYVVWFRDVLSWC